MYGIIDCDNCYVSCERVFRPDLNGKPMKGIMTFFLRLLPGKLQFSELALVDRDAPDGVFFSVTSPDGKVKDSEAAAVKTVCVFHVCLCFILLKR